jgi:uncharacterized protein (DUF58 family)
VLHRRAIVFLLSDFMDRGYEKALKQTARRHDLIAIRVTDPREDSLPAVGLVQLEDAETGQQVLIDTSSRKVREAYAADAVKRREGIRQLMRSAGVDLIEASTDGTHLNSLVKFFRLRERRRRRR